jgi:hypothetical protein
MIYDPEKVAKKRAAEEAAAAETKKNSGSFWSRLFGK